MEVHLFFTWVVSALSTNLVVPIEQYTKSTITGHFIKFINVTLEHKTSHKCQFGEI